MDEQIIKVADLLEQIKDVNRMIEIHLDDEDDFMQRQYRHRREKFMAELSNVMKVFKIAGADMAA